MAGIAVYTQDLHGFDASRARRLAQRLRVEIGKDLEAVYALVWPDYPEGTTPHPQQNRAAFAQWRAEAGVPLWGWFNAQPDQAADVEALGALTTELDPAGWLLDIEGDWTKGAKLKTLIEGAVATGRPVRASLAGATPSHVEYDYRTLDKHGVPIEWQAYFDSGEGTRPEAAVRELFRSSFVIEGWEYRHRIGTPYSWGKVGRVVNGRAKLDSYRHPGTENADFAVRAGSGWGWTVVDGTLLRGSEQIGTLMGRAAYRNIRVVLDVSRGNDDKHTLDEWTQIAAGAKYPGADKRPISVYMGEATTDDVLVAIAKGAA